MLRTIAGSVVQAEEQRLANSQVAAPQLQPIEPLMAPEYLAHIYNQDIAVRASVVGKTHLKKTFAPMQPCAWVLRLNFHVTPFAV